MSLFKRPTFKHGDTDLTRGKVFQCTGTTKRGKRCKHYVWIGFPHYHGFPDWQCVQHREESD
jgi:hypothetical protein